MRAVGGVWLIDTKLILAIWFPILAITGRVFMMAGSSIFNVHLQLQTLTLV
jgi:hypothetical protein